ncbi:MAG TPA: SdiA-regulated domain-containing protein [Flavisolibacter sp.]|nr:SdiA-regulated domain-containing protein [Flavisolibacter sp.]
MNQLIQTKCPVWLGMALGCTITLIMGCKEQSYASPEGYDINKPVKENLGKVLNEISGICFNNDDNTLLAISDSKEKVFQINVDKQKLKDYTDKVVGPDTDLEDIVKVDSTVYLLSSKGVIYEIPKEKDTVRTYTFHSNDQNDFETLYYDPSVKSLIMVCKECPADKGKSMRSAYRFDLSKKQFDPSAFFTFSTEEVKKLLNDDNAKFDPSAACIHPVNKRLYVLSSAGNLLVITDTRGKIIEAYQLNEEQFPQAEGIAFAPNGDMFISNEGKYGAPTLQMFKYQNSKNK